MKYSEFGLVNTKQMFKSAIEKEFAVPAFNFYNMETLRAILNAADETKSPVILAVSESAMKYMGADMLMGMISGAQLKGKNIALHLDHGSSFESCKFAIDIGFSSVMIDASSMPWDQNLELSKKVADYAHQFNVSTEAELGTLSGIEDENTNSEHSVYTNPDDVIRFVDATNIDSLAIAIGTSHGAYKRKNESEELRFDILEKIASALPEFPLVLHGASSIPSDLVKTINNYGGNMGDARGIAPAQLRRAVSMNVCKINVDSDSRLAFTAAVREVLSKNPEIFDPRKYLGAAISKMTDTYIWEIREIMNSAGFAN